MIDVIWFTAFILIYNVTRKNWRTRSQSLTCTSCGNNTVHRLWFTLLIWHIRKSICIQLRQNITTFYKSPMQSHVSQWLKLQVKVWGRNEWMVALSFYGSTFLCAPTPKCYLHHPNNIWSKVQVMEFSSSSCYFLSFISNYSSQHTVFKALILSSILKMGHKILHL
jgi:hypothetical protein